MPQTLTSQRFRLSQSPSCNLRVEHARALTAMVVQEDEAVSNSLFGIVICLPAPISCARVHAGCSRRSAVRTARRRVAWGRRRVVCRSYRGRRSCILIYPCHCNSVDDSGDYVSDCSLFFNTLLGCDLSGFVSMVVKVLMEMTTLMYGRLKRPLALARAGAIKSELF